MKITELELLFVKNYLRVDGDEDDALIEVFLASAKSFIENHLNQKFSDMEEVPEEFTIPCLALISHWYSNRTITSGAQNERASKEILYTFSHILDPHIVRKMGE